MLNSQKIYWKQRGKIKGVKFGDENTKKIQAVATERYRRNNIASFRKENGSLVDTHTGKEALLFQTYTDRLGTSRPTEMKFNLPNILQRHDDLDQLTEPFTHDEIDAVIKEMPADHAPEPDCFSVAFLKA